MSEVSPLRLNILRAVYLLIAAGLAVTMWPRVISHGSGWPLMNSVVACLLTALSLLAFFGLRYPLRMLPLLLFELLWKTIWLGAVALPLWASGRMDPATIGTVTDCLPAIILVPAIPWRHVWASYVRAPAERWREA